MKKMNENDKYKIILELRCPLCEDLLSEPHFIPEIVRCWQCKLTWEIEGKITARLIKSE